MNTVRSNVVVKADDPNDNVEMKNGKKLWIDTSFNPQQHAVISGEVIATGPNVKDLQKGDRVFFHYNCYRDNFRLFHNKDDLLRVPLELIYCKLRDGEMEMMDDKLLVEPIDNPEYKSENDIVLTNQSKYKELHAKVAYLPKNYKGDMKAGDTIIYDPESDIPIKIGGTTYFRMEVGWVQAILTNH